jgi:hypothetical protein
MSERERRSIRTVTPSHLRQGLEDQASTPVVLPPNLRRSRAERLGSRLIVLLQVFVFVAVIVIPAGAVARTTTSQPTPAGDEATPPDPAPTTSERGSATKIAKPTAEPDATPKAKPKATRSTPKATVKQGTSKKGSTRGNTKKTTTTPTTETPTVTTASLLPPTIVSDKADYAPGETVTLTGENWADGEVVHIYVNDTLGSSWSRNVDVTASAAGQIVDAFSLPTWFVSNYNVIATGPISGTATTTFTDMSIGTYDQCANDDGDGFGGDPGVCDWVNGNLQHSNSTYHEGDATPQRLWLTGFVPGSPHTVTFQYGTTKAAKHAYDFLTRFNFSETWITVADQCDGIAGCETAPQVPASIPHDSHVPGSFEVGTREFVMRGGTFPATPVSTPSLVSGVYGSGDSETAVTVSFTVASSGSMCHTKGNSTTCDVAIWFGAHIADSDDWEGSSGDGFGGATTIPGSPYHVSLAAVDGSSAGERDNQMQAGAIVEPGTIIVEKQTLPDGAAGSFTFTGDASGSIGDNGQIIVTPLLPGTYTSTEASPPAGFTLTSIACDDGASATPSTFNVGTRTATFGLDPGETVKCTFTNTKGASLDVDKTTVGGDGTFNFVGSGTNVPAAPQIITAGGTGSIPDISFDSTQFGDKEITETVPSGWTLTGIACTGDTTGLVIGRYTAGVFGNGGSDGFDAGDTTFRVNIGAGENVNCVYTNTKRGTIIVEKQTNPDGAVGSFVFTGDAAGTISDNGQITVPNLVPGTYTSTETNPSPAFDLAAITCDDTGSATPSIPDAPTRTATFKLDPGETVKCTFTNTQRGHVQVIKTQLGVTPPTGSTFTFELRSGATADQVNPSPPPAIIEGNPGTLLETLVANDANSYTLNFTTFLVPGQTYQLCEVVPAVGWNIDFVGYTEFNLTIGGINTRVCVDFTVTAGETKSITVDNTPPPGGDARTIGFWKNWSSCDGKGNQDDILDQTLTSMGSILIGDLTVLASDNNACEILVDLLDKRDYKAAALLKDGKKQASDPAFNFAAQYIAYLLNIEAGAGTCAAASSAAAAGQAILDAISFDGSTGDGDAAHTGISALQKANLNTYANTLDLYNNNQLCP